MKKIMSLAFVALAFYFTSCQENPESANNENKDSAEQAEEINEDKNVEGKDADFAVKAAELGMKEVELSQLAVKHAVTKEVKDFAQMMVTDHAKSNEELKTLAASKQITVPAELTQDTKDAMDDLTKKSGIEFDKEYMNKMVKDHKDAVDKFEEAAKDNKVAEIKSFAANALPNLKHHLEMAEKLQETIKERKK